MTAPPVSGLRMENSPFLFTMTTARLIVLRSASAGVVVVIRALPGLLQMILICIYLFQMSKGTVCHCPESKKPVKERKWYVRRYQCHHSAFNGWRETYSDYSLIECTACKALWRTKANYVEEIHFELWK